MFGRGINIRLLLSFFFLLMFVMYFACVQSISEPEKENFEIINTSIELDRFAKELFFQVETNQKKSQNLIQEVLVELTYIGEDIHEYSATFELYDNGTNGDLIPYNGIYTLLTSSDTVALPDITPGIFEIDIPNNFQLHKTKEDSMDISLTIYGKTFKVKTEVFDNLNLLLKDSITVNLNNSLIEIYVNNDYLYKDRIEEDDICKREQTSNPNLNNYWLYNTLSYGSPSSNYTNQFYFNQKVRFKSVNDCGGYGKVFFKFKLIDLDTGSDSTANNIELLIYGCGDGYCTAELENTNTCPGDCR